jgi:hypothetical protein
VQAVQGLGLRCVPIRDALIEIGCGNTIRADAA